MPWLLMRFWLVSHDLGFEDFVGVRVLGQDLGALWLEDSWVGSNSDCAG